MPNFTFHMSGNIRIRNDVETTISAANYDDAKNALQDEIINTWDEYELDFYSLNVIGVHCDNEAVKIEPFEPFGQSQPMTPITKTVFILTVDSPDNGIDTLKFDTECERSSHIVECIQSFIDVDRSEIEKWVLTDEIYPFDSKFHEGDLPTFYTSEFEVTL